jgi:hypothetical protein
MHRGKESFDTHVWMLKTLLSRSLPEEDQTHFLKYITAASFPKMIRRMDDKQISVPYYACLQNLKTFPFIELSSVVQKPERDSNFITVIRRLDNLADTKIPNLLLATNLPQPIEIYNESTCMEFHLLLCELLSKFEKSLQKLKKLQRGEKRELEAILDGLRDTEVYAFFLRVMVGSFAIEIHLQTIAHLLVVDNRKSWTPEFDSEEMLDEDTDLADFQPLKPYSMRKGKQLLPWESYRDWLRLMVHYFDAADLLMTHVKPFEELPPLKASITILSPPYPDDLMLSWTKLLEDERFFPTPQAGELSGKDFIKFLTDTSADVPTMPDLNKILTLTRQLKENLDSDKPTSVILTGIEEILKKRKSVDWHDVITKILALKNLEPQNQSAEMRTIMDILKSAPFYLNLQAGRLYKGEFKGTHHCEAYIASLLAVKSHSGQHVGNLKERLGILPQELLDEIKASHVFMYRLNLC